MKTTMDVAFKRNLSLIAILGTTAWIMAWFIPPLVWAVYAAIAAWPLLRTLKMKANRQGAFIARNAHGIAASCVLLFGVLLGVAAAQSVIDEAAQLLSPETASTTMASIEELGLLEKVRHIPLIGQPLFRFAKEASVEHFLEAHNFGALLSEGTLIGSAVFAWVASFVFFAIAFGYLLKNGAQFSQKLKFSIANFFGPAYSSHLDHQAVLIRSMFSSIVVLGTVETLLFWAAFSCAGVKQAALYALVLGATSMVPLLPSFLAAIICCGVAVFGSLSTALALGGFCATVFFVFDPIVRPFLAGKNIELPYWLLTLAMIAGLQTFGLIGIFICPQIVLLLRHMITVEMTDPRAVDQEEPAPTDATADENLN